jgi:hypothetical protein
MTNNLLGMANIGYPNPASQTTMNGSLYSRTTLPGGPPATDGVAVPFGGITIVNGLIQINLTQTFQYLVVAYDGKNAGVAVFDISSFGAGDTIQLYAYAAKDLAHPGDLLGSDHAQQGYYLVTSYSLLNPLGVPDGGATVMLLGAGLGALGIVRRYLTR